ncbi:FKBP12-associated protein [Aspergillus hancockii]|nr:FKBP12-associated protein [Aspergillus hancockii]
MSVPDERSNQISTIVTMMDAPTPAAEGGSSHPRPSRRGGRGRGNRGAPRRPQTQATQPSHDTQPSSEQPRQAQPTEASPSDPSPDALRSRRGPRRGRGGGRGGGAPPEGSSRRQRQRGGDRGATSTGRRFEGRLTKPEQGSEEGKADGTADSIDPSLRADAPEFVPGQSENSTNGAAASSTTPTSAKKKPKPKNTQPPPLKVTTKSVAPDIATRIHEDILHNLYECPICTAELGKRNGQETKVPLHRTLAVAKEKETPIHFEPGVVLAVTFLTKYFRQATLAGVRKRLIRGHSPVFLRTRAGKPAHDRVKAAHIRAMRLVMRGLVLPVQLWVQRRIASATRIMKTDGAAAKFVETFCPAGSILALGHAMKVYAEIVE